MELKEENFKYNDMSKKELEVSIKRLTRFKYPPDKKQRVYKQILTKHSLEPKISTRVFNSLKKAESDKLASIVWNNSQTVDSKIDIWQDDIRCFNSKRMLEDILESSLEEHPNPKQLNKILKEQGYKPSKTAKSYNDFYLEIQRQYPINIPAKTTIPKINIVLLVEGATEEILLPKFAKILGEDFKDKGVFIIASGGKNQVAKSYLEHKYNLRLPMIVVMDEDAVEQADDIKKVIRAQDKIFLIEQGEFEDILCPKLILKTLNSEFKNTAKILASDLKKDLPMTKTLYEIYREKGLGEFKKVEFAKAVEKNIKTKSDISNELEKLIMSFFK